MTDIPDKFKDALTNWESVADNHADWGAADGEPREVMFHLLKMQIKHDKNYLPLTAMQWQLYSITMDCEDVAAKLNNATQEIFDSLKGLSYAEVDGIVEHYDL